MVRIPDYDALLAIVCDGLGVSSDTGRAALNDFLSEVWYDGVGDGTDAEVYGKVIANPYERGGVYAK